MSDRFTARGMSHVTSKTCTGALVRCVSSCPSRPHTRTQSSVCLSAQTAPSPPWPFLNVCVLLVKCMSNVGGLTAVFTKDTLVWPRRLPVSVIGCQPWAHYVASTGDIVPEDTLSICFTTDVHSHTHLSERLRKDGRQPTEHLDPCVLVLTHDEPREEKVSSLPIRRDCVVDKYPQQLWTLALD